MNIGGAKITNLLISDAGDPADTTWGAPEELGTAYPLPQWSCSYISELVSVKVRMGVKIVQSQ